MTKEEFLELVKKYGYECMAGGAGYTHDDSDFFMTQIIEEVNKHWGGKSLAK